MVNPNSYSTIDPWNSTIDTTGCWQTWNFTCISVNNQEMSKFDHDGLIFYKNDQICSFLHTQPTLNGEFWLLMHKLVINAQCEMIKI